MNVLEESGCDKVILDRSAALVYVEAKENDGNNMIELIRQIVEWINIPIFAWVQWFLASSTFLKGRFQCLFEFLYFRMIVRLGDMMPPFLAHVNRIAIPIIHNPSNTDVSHLDYL
ncbi:protein of unknown function [Candidatus Promineifilum breve]|uniref:Uncharacterized protein n=1 Tax=Candidatus Promineifilum breve TaxID=1806508 RepID=A0A170PED9_9CHLR|nr:protein of unknown function [Candidatus Promineifilum breve]